MIGHLSTPKEVRKMTKTHDGSAARVALATALILLLAMVSMQITD
jgi:hypothetical protein